ncbi:hypothetical protein DSO57_1008715 [Entomophthora muscae]|uniref:Uncharacterized protein n=1 Tax=Entomophthora muscae TaxID=34485 RepID=A0ACC2SW72_9FUNG|nr:hypothetical protein DSO57_1008715 [Entomophthora muscae]
MASTQASRSTAQPCPWHQASVSIPTTRTQSSPMAKDSQGTAGAAQSTLTPATDLLRDGSMLFVAHVHRTYLRGLTKAGVQA